MMTLPQAGNARRWAATPRKEGNVKETILESPITQDIQVETHNDWKVFILRQSTIGNEQRPAVDNSIVMTQDQLAKLVAAQHGVHWTLATVWQNWRSLFRRQSQ